MYEVITTDKKTKRATTIDVTTGSLMPASSDGASLGTGSAEFSDIFLADGAEISLGDNQEVTLTHIEDEGLRLNSLNQLQFGFVKLLDHG